MTDLHFIGGDVNTPHPSGYIFENNGRPEWLFMHFVSPFFYDIGGVRHDGRSGDCLLNTPDTLLCHGPANLQEEGFVNDWFYFSGADAAELIRTLELPVNQAFSVGDVSTIRRRIKTMVWENEHPLPGARMIQASEIMALLVDLHRGLIAIRSDDPTRRNLSELRDYIFSHLDENWTLSDMARRIGYSTSRFTMLYRRFFGSSPISDLIRARVMNARNLLLYSEHSIGRISELCGFASAQYFTNTYRAMTGESPSQTKRGHK